MSDVSRDPSVYDEPHLRGEGFEVDEREDRAAENLAYEREGDIREDDAVEHSVWDEPGLSTELSDAPQSDAITYRGWLETRARETSLSKSLGVTLLLALAAGPWAIFGTFFSTLSGQGTWVVLLAVVVVGPLVEEMMKICAALYIVEKRPFLFKSRAQILVCAIASGLVFAGIENLIYFNVYIKEPTAAMIFWRQTVCVALHTGCSAIASLGLMRIWSDTWKRRAAPRLPLAYPYIVTAIVVHGAYNGTAVLMSAVGFDF